MKLIWGLSVSLLLINLAQIVEKADESLLPAVYKEVSEEFKLSPSQLGTLTFVRTLLQALFSPVAGVLAMQFYRPSVIGLGTLFWAISTAAIGLSKNFTICTLSRAVNGVGLAIVVPALQSFIADSYPEGGRGVAFGWLNLVGGLGAIAGSASATVMASYTFWGMPGWRAAFLLMACVSSLIGLLVHWVVVDPRPDREVNGAREGRSLRRVWLDFRLAVRDVLKIPTFQIILMQGVVGSLPWMAMVFFTMWLELIGFGHKSAASLTSIFSGGCAIGSLFGGWMGDKVERKFPGKGRIMCAQFSSFMGIPCSWLLLHVLPQDPQHWALFAATFLFMGLTISWCQACANNPMFAEVVPEEYRTVIYSFDRAIEGAIGALAAPLVGLLAEHVYGYRVDLVIPKAGSPAESVALSSGLLAMMAVPFGICCLCYTPLYITYGRDRDMAQTAMRRYSPVFDEESMKGFTEL